jgi:hypothetical protein
MTTGEPSLSSAQLLARRLLRNRKVDEQSRPLPVVVLLGPAGSGKSHALKSINDDCGGVIVHARFDFDREPAPTTVEVLTRIAFAFSRNWPVRGRPRFTRFTLGLIAVQADLSGMTREQARDELRAKIKQFTGNPRADWLAARIEEMANAARTANVLPPALAEAVIMALPPLVRTVGRHSVNDAQRWHADIPQAQQSSPLDALVTLNEDSRDQPAEMIGWLTAAFLADVRESHPRLAKPDPRSDCVCPTKAEGKHYHNWLLLLDNLDHPGGVQFLDDLKAARDRYRREHEGQHDALMIIGTSGRWNDDLTDGWRPPWNSPPPEPDGLRAVPHCGQASYQHWAGLPEPTRHYPVLVDSLTIDETAKMLRQRELSPRSKVAQRVSGGLPAALGVVAGLLTQRDPRPGARDVLRPMGSGQPEAVRWRSRLDDLSLAAQLPDIGIDEFVSAAPFATAPWLVPERATSLVSRPHVGRILTELRTALWVNAQAHSGGTADYAELHPWIARTLVTALAARRSSPEEPAYLAQFTALLDDADTQADPARKAYCQLALGQVSEVIGMFETSFNAGPHRAWTDRLRLVTRAPDNWPLERRSYDLYQDLVRRDTVVVPTGRSPVGNIVRRLVIARWLAANPFATPDPELRTVVTKAYAELPHWSQQPDVAALAQAAERDLRELF